MSFNFTGNLAEVFGTGHSFETIFIDDGYPFFERWELYRERRYKDGIRRRDTPEGPKGSIIWSIAFGHAEGGDVEPKIITADMRFTLEQARELLRKDIAKKFHFVKVRVKVPITTWMRCGITSFVYQYGNGRVDETGFFTILNEGRYTDAFEVMLESYYTQDGKPSKGHKFRRACEIALCFTKI